MLFGLVEDTEFAGEWMMQEYPEREIKPLFEEVTPNHGGNCVCETCFPLHAEAIRRRIDATDWGNVHHAGSEWTVISRRDLAELQGRLVEAEKQLGRGNPKVATPAPLKNVRALDI